MSKRGGRRAAIIGAVVGVAVVAAVLYAVRQPLLESWYLWQLESDDPEAVEAAAKGLAEVGSARAYPALVSLAERRYGGADARKGIEFLNSQLADWHETVQRSRREHGGGSPKWLDVACLYGESAYKVLFRSEPGFLAAGELRALGQVVHRHQDELLPFVREDLASESSLRRWAAVVSLREISTLDESTVEALALRLHDEDPLVSLEAHHMLERLDDASSDAIGCVLYKFPPPSPAPDLPSGLTITPR